MGFSKMIELLQEKDKGKIILINAGSFYIARGKDAILLNNLFNLKLNCLETEVCKVGFPINSLEKYTKLIEEKNYSYIVYNFDNKLYKLKELKKYIGKKINNITDNRLNCYICKCGKLTSKEAQKFLAGHMGYIKIANTKNLEEKLFYNE